LAQFLYVASLVQADIEKQAPFDAGGDAVSAIVRIKDMMLAEDAF